jgi:hypothetical protein
MVPHEADFSIPKHFVLYKTEELTTIPFRDFPFSLLYPGQPIQQHIIIGSIELKAHHLLI